LIIKDGLGALREGRFHPYHISELSSAIATLELGHGANKKARKLFVEAMKAPTENSSAQFEWAVKNKCISRPEGLVCEVPGNFEARTYIAYAAKDWKTSLKFGWRWCLDQPFSLEAATWGSYIASTTLSEYKVAINIARIGLMANPNSWLLKNNLAFSLAKSDQAIEAAEILDATVVPKDDVEAQATLLATRGLVHFRRNSPEQGRVLYRQALDVFQEEKKLKSKFIALAFWLIEESRVKSDTVAALVAEIEEVSRKVHGAPETNALLEKIKMELKGKWKIK
jgi:tetratricopeptide (TPR) repeat protein